jgi:hypothetical protein
MIPVKGSSLDWFLTPIEQLESDSLATPLKTSLQTQGPILMVP